MILWHKSVHLVNYIDAVRTHSSSYPFGSPFLFAPCLWQISLYQFALFASSLRLRCDNTSPGMFIICQLCSPAGDSWRNQFMANSSSCSAKVVDSFRLFVILVHLEFVTFLNENLEDFIQSSEVGETNYLFIILDQK